jgi:protein-tyrosine phosphatase
VCLGNICRSPTAEAVLRQLAKEKGVDRYLHVESAATSHYSLGEPPDHRSQQAAKKRGFNLSGSAKLFRASDFQRFDYVLGADQGILDDLRALSSDDEDRKKIHLITFCSQIYKDLPIPDPYYQGQDGFELVLDMLEESCLNLINCLYFS